MDMEPQPSPSPSDTVSVSEEGEVPNWREHLEEEDLKIAIKVIKAIEACPDLKACASGDDASLLRDLFVVCHSVFMPSRAERKAHTRKKQKMKVSMDQALLQSTVIRTHRKVTTDYKMVHLTPAPETMMVEDTKDDVDMEPIKDKQDPSINSNESPTPRSLNYARRCCICGSKFKELHHFYDKMCGPCAEFNYGKRTQIADLSGRIALVTGGRVKIGFKVAVKLLHSGAFVIVTSRFPHDAVLRFAAEPDFQEWKDRIKVYGVDFRDIPSVHRFCIHLKETYDRLDIIIGNAAQTVRRPPSYYRHLIDDETKPLPAPLLDLVSEGSERIYVSTNGAAKAVSVMPFNNTPVVPVKENDSLDSKIKGSGVAVAHSVALSQVALMVGDENHDNTLFPQGVYDRDLQQLDLRDSNSWTQTMDEVSPVELMECHAINSFAPFIINSELKPLMEKSPATDKYIVNVSAMEGQFYRNNKTVYHPHTNMAKASLNMMTRTAAAGYAKSNIYMTCVDTGWITDENPVDKHDKRALDPPPLDELDAAMRILDPVLTGVT
eukprot:Ihof_evm1s111 gene=Ihof_evmTU1s111